MNFHEGCHLSQKIRNDILPIRFVLVRARLEQPLARVTYIRTARCIIDTATPNVARHRPPLLCPPLLEIGQVCVHVYARCMRIHASGYRVAFYKPLSRVLAINISRCFYPADSGEPNLRWKRTQRKTCVLSSDFCLLVLETVPRLDYRQEIRVDDLYEAVSFRKKYNRASSLLRY